MLTINTGILENQIGFLFQFSKEIEIELSCGHSVKLKMEDLKRDIPCPCGNPNHWIVKWEINE